MDNIRDILKLIDETEVLSERQKWNTLDNIAAKYAKKGMTLEDLAKMEKEAMAAEPKDLDAETKKGFKGFFKNLGRNFSQLASTKQFRRKYTLAVAAEMLGLPGLYGTSGKYFYYYYDSSRANNMRDEQSGFKAGRASKIQAQKLADVGLLPKSRAEKFDIENKTSDKDDSKVKTDPNAKAGDKTADASASDASKKPNPYAKMDQAEVSKKAFAVMKEINALLDKMNEGLSFKSSIGKYLLENSQVINEALSAEETKKLADLLDDLEQMVASGKLEGGNLSLSKDTVARASSAIAKTTKLSPDEVLNVDTDAIAAAIEKAPKTDIKNNNSTECDTLRAFASSGKGGLKNDPDEVEAVKALQTLLGVAVDGKYGPETTSAVRTYQEKNNLTVDGDAGPNTIEKLCGEKEEESNDKGEEGSGESSNTNLPENFKVYQEYGRYTVGSLDNNATYIIIGPDGKQYLDSVRQSDGSTVEQGYKDREECILVAKQLDKADPGVDSDGEADTDKGDGAGQDNEPNANDGSVDAVGSEEDPDVNDQEGGVGGTDGEVADVTGDDEKDDQKNNKDKSAETDPKVDEGIVDDIYDAVKGIGTDEDDLFAALRAIRDANHYKTIVKIFKQKYPKAINDDYPTLAIWMRDDLEGWLWNGDDVKKFDREMNRLGIKINKPVNPNAVKGMTPVWNDTATPTATFTDLSDAMTKKKQCKKGDMVMIGKTKVLCDSTDQGQIFFVNKDGTPFDDSQNAKADPNAKAGPTTDLDTVQNFLNKKAGVETPKTGVETPKTAELPGAPYAVSGLPTGYVTRKQGNQIHIYYNGQRISSVRAGRNHKVNVRNSANKHAQANGG